MAYLLTDRSVRNFGVARDGGKRELIKAEALRLFATRGVDAVSVQDIATACAMAKPNLYAHFASKDALVAQLFTEGYRDYGEKMRAAVAGSGPFADKLACLVRLICLLHDTDQMRFRFILMTQHANLSAIAIDAANPVEIVVRLVQAAIVAGEIPPGNAELLAACIIGLVVQPATFLLYGRIGDGLAPHVDTIVAMCLRVTQGSKEDVLF